MLKKKVKAKKEGPTHLYARLNPTNLRWVRELQMKKNRCFTEVIEAAVDAARTGKKFDLGEKITSYMRRAEAVKASRLARLNAAMPGANFAVQSSKPIQKSKKVGKKAGLKKAAKPKNISETAATTATETAQH